MWLGLIKVAATWIPVDQRGRVMAVLSLAYLIDDIIVRGVIGALTGAVGFAGVATVAW